MPLIKLHTSVSISEQKRDILLSSMSKILSEKIGKPQQYIMVLLADSTPMIMSGNAEPAAYADVRSIGGLSADVNRTITGSLCDLLKEYLHIGPERVYVNFTDVAAGNWGWDGRTFG